MTRYTLRAHRQLTNHFSSPISLIHDHEPERESELDFHAQADDYFVTLATIINLLREQLLSNADRHNKIMERTIKDLIYLQKHYRLTKKKPLK